MENNAPLSNSPRLYYLDWLRVFAIILVLYYHTGMLYVSEWGWHIKDTETSNVMMEWMFFLNRWRMSLLFVISGAGSYFLINSITKKNYLWERFKRLIIPLLFGILVIVPPQIYMERINSGIIYSSYFDFYKTVFNGVPYPTGNTSWHHLWFIFYLFLYSVIAYPVFLLFKTKIGENIAIGITYTIKKVSIYAFAVPIFIVLACLVLKYPGPQNVVNDWAAFWAYFILFFVGYLLNTNDWYWQNIEENRRLSAKIAFVLIIGINYLRWNDLEFDVLTIGWYFYMFANVLFSLCMIFALIGYGRKYLNYTNKYIQYANLAIYPFYILHQTIIVILGYHTAKIEEGVLLEFLFVSTLTFIVTIGLYEYFIKPYKITRFLFGMK